MSTGIENTYETFRWTTGAQYRTPSFRKTSWLADQLKLHISLANWKLITKKIKKISEKEILILKFMADNEACSKTYILDHLLRHDTAITSAAVVSELKKLVSQGKLCTKKSGRNFIYHIKVDAEF